MSSEAQRRALAWIVALLFLVLLSSVCTGDMRRPESPATDSHTLLVVNKSAMHVRIRAQPSRRHLGVATAGETCLRLNVEESDRRFSLKATSHRPIATPTASLAGRSWTLELGPSWRMWRWDVMSLQPGPPCDT